MAKRLGGLALSFVRPEAATALWRWREVLFGAGTVLLGLWWAATFYGAVAWLGWVIVIGGAALIAAGIQRSRFRIPGQGPGIVQITEGQITYFGPLTGGVIALSELSRIALDPSGNPAHWVLSQPAQPDLFIPLTADGSDALFDIFASLPGMRTEYMLAQMKRTDGPSVQVWSRDSAFPLPLSNTP